jgi:integral membrane sensor domain MASE1
VGRLIGNEPNPTNNRSGSTKRWLLDIVVGGLGGAVVGAIVAVNVVIYSGIGDGYQASLGDWFGYSPVLGIAVIALLVAAPICGIIAMRKLRRNQTVRPSK